MSQNVKITGSAQTIVGSGRLLGVIICSHSSGTLQLNDQPQAGNLGAALLDTYTFPSGSGYLPLYGEQFTNGVYATCGGTLDVLLVWTPDTSGVIN